MNNITNINKIFPGQKLKVIQQPKYVIMLIGDGLGFSQRQVAEYYNEQVLKNNEKLIMDQLPISGVNTTYSKDSLITDSAAAGTALASGIKTNNGVIGKDENLVDVVTIVELAEKAGMATGIITTTRLTHATPAAFASHNVHRDNENDIAMDFLDSGVDFFAGGGLRHFIIENNTGSEKDYTDTTIKSKRTDGEDLIADFEALGYETFVGNKGADEFMSANFEEGDQVFAAFTNTHMPYEIDRINEYPELPSLADMTKQAINCLSTDKDGFFLMVEGGRIDHAAHQNDAAAMVMDTLAFDAAVQEAYNFYEKHQSETLILVVGDHETGGLGLGMDTQGYFMDVTALAEPSISIADLLSYTDLAYNGDRDAYVNTIKTKLGLELTDKEAAKLYAAMDAQDSGETFGYYAYDPVPVAVAHIQSERANIFWTTTIHTGTAIPLSAIGVESNVFMGYLDNTEIANRLIEAMGFKK
ncbi:MAG: alkaline phosphatase [Clostridia bacterium]|nr:alkaline phosphatase [Clostridia bacterium]